MPAPRKEVFFLYSAISGIPLLGQLPLMSFSCYTDDGGVPITPTPQIEDLGNGAYGFNLEFPDDDHGIVYIVDSGAGAAPAHYARYARPQDWHSDNADIQSSLVRDDLKIDISRLKIDLDYIRTYHEGKWEVKVAGPDINRLVLYGADGTTILQKYDLFDGAGAPTTTNPFKRVPVLPVVTSPEKTVESFGAVGDGTTNDQTAIQAAFDSGGRIVFQGGKVYIVTGSLTLNNNSEIYSKNGKATLKQSTTAIAGQRIIEDFSSTNITIHHLIFDGNKTNHPISEQSHGLFLSSVTNYEVFNCVFHNTGGDGMIIHGTSTNGYIHDNEAFNTDRTAFNPYSSNNTLVARNVVHDVPNYAFKMEEDDPVIIKNIQFIDNVATQNVYGGLAISGVSPGYIQNIHVKGNRFTTPNVVGADKAIAMTGVRDVVISKNIIEQHYPEAAIEILTNSSDITIRGNDIISTGTLGNASCITIGGGTGPVVVSDVTIEKNTLHKAEFGVRILGIGPLRCSDITIEKNTVYEILNGGVHVGDAIDLTCRTNYFQDCGWGIVFAGSAGIGGVTNAIVDNGNVFAGNVNAGIQFFSFSLVTNIDIIGNDFCAEPPLQKIIQTVPPVGIVNISGNACYP